MRSRRSAARAWKRSRTETDMAQPQLKVTLLRSLHGQLKNIAACARGLGLRRIRQSVLVADTRENRGMIAAAVHLLRVEKDEGGYATEHTQPRPRLQARAPARRPRRFRRPGQDLRARHQGPARAQGRLPQGRLRGRPDAAAAAHAQGPLSLRY